MMNAQVQKISHELAFIPNEAERLAISQVSVQSREILVAAMQGKQISQMNDMELDMLVASVVNTGLLNLGHKSQLVDQRDSDLFCDSISSLLREKWHYLTENEVRLVFKMGVRGDFKAKKEDVVFLNEPNINDWFKAYRYSLKSEANLQKQKLLTQIELNAKPLPMTDEDLFQMNIERLEAAIEKLNEGEPYFDFDIGNVLYKWLTGLGVINLSDAAKRKILEEERTKLLAEKKPESRGIEVKVSYSLFAKAIETGKFVSGNKFEEEAIVNAQKETFKGFILSLLEAQEDIRTKIMEQIESNNNELNRLSKLSANELVKTFEYHKSQGDRHKMSLVTQVQQNRPKTA